MWLWVALACVVAYGTKLVGYLIPRDRLDSPGFHRAAGTVTVGLLAALIVMNTFADGQALRIDSRLVALVVAVAAFALRAPYLLVVVLGAAAAALARLAGLP